MRLFFKSLISFLCLMIILVWLLLVQSKPIVDTKSSEQVEHADKVLNLFSDLRLSLKNRYTPYTVKVSHQQAESLVGFVQRALPNIKANFTFGADHAVAQFSYQLPDYLFANFINVTVKILPADSLMLETVKIGSLTIPGDWALGLAEYAANLYTNSQVATVAIAQINSVAMTSNRITVALHPMDAFLNEAKKVETGGDSSQAKLRNIKIAHYIRVLDGMYIPPPKNHQRASSLSYYIQGIMKEAKAQSMHPDSSARLENEAAILALAAFAGHRQFANFVGDFSFTFDVIPQAKQRPSLANREDLSLHFIFSAAIKLLSEQGISVAVGEFKELMDRRRGGSGYSFVDLSADMAGAHFAALAVNPEYAQHIQAVLAEEADEAFFFPDIEGLEEGMDKKSFERKYQAVDSPKYKSVVAQIQSRIDNLIVSNR